MIIVPNFLHCYGVMPTACVPKISCVTVSLTCFFQDSFVISKHGRQFLLDKKKEHQSRREAYGRKWILRRRWE